MCHLWIWFWLLCLFKLCCYSLFVLPALFCWWSWNLGMLFWVIGNEIKKPIMFHRGDMFCLIFVTAISTRGFKFLKCPYFVSLHGFGVYLCSVLQRESASFRYFHCCSEGILKWWWVMRNRMFYELSLKYHCFNRPVSPSEAFPRVFVPRTQV